MENWASDDTPDNKPGNSQVTFKRQENSLLTSIQSQVSGDQVDVRIRCSDHDNPLDGLGAHKLVLAAASPSLLRPLLLELDDIVCLHLPDYTSEQVSHLMSLLYYGEVWLTMAKFSKEFSTLIRDLDITANLTFRTPRRDVKMEEEEEVVVEEEEEEGETASHKKEVLRDTVIDLTTVEDLQVTVQAPETDSTARLILEMLEEPVEAKEGVPPACRQQCPEPGCNYSTESLSSFQSHRLVHERKRMTRKATLMCPACSQDDIGYTPQGMEDHLEEVHYEKCKEKCDLAEDCSQTFCSLDELVHHYYDNHLVERGTRQPAWIRCDHPGCLYSTRISSNMTQHLRVHNDERNYECSVCQQKFLLASHLKTHQATHTKELKHSCDFCDKAFATSWQKKSHTKNNHTKQKQTKFPCNTCKRSFLKYQSLSAHLRVCKAAEEEGSQAASNPKKSFQVCESCGDQLKGGANSLRRHQCVCRTGDVSLRCPVCSKVLKSRSFKAHMQYHKSQEQNRDLLVCVYCDNKPFTSAISLKRHMLIHENARPFQCKDCDKSFRQKGALTVHERVHSGIRYSCMCGKLFITKSLLNRHRKIASVRSSCHGPGAESRV